MGIAIQCTDELLVLHIHERPGGHVPGRNAEILDVIQDDEQSPASERLNEEVDAFARGERRKLGIRHTAIDKPDQLADGEVEWQGRIAAAVESEPAVEWAPERRPPRSRNPNLHEPSS